MNGQSTQDAVSKYVQATRDDLSRGKVEIIAEVMRLSPDQSNVFWPIFQDYETELFELGDQRVAMIRRFVTAEEARALDDQKAAELSKEFFQYESARLELGKKYHALIANELSPLHAAQFTQIEHRMGTVIDLLIATELPLVSGAAGQVASSPLK